MEQIRTLHADLAVMYSAGARSLRVMFRGPRLTYEWFTYCTHCPVHQAVLGFLCEESTRMEYRLYYFILRYTASEGTDSSGSRESKLQPR